MDKFFNELKSELLNLEKTTRPKKSDNPQEPFEKLYDIANNGISLGELEKNMGLILDKLLIKYNITKNDQEFKNKVKDIYILVASQRLQN